MITRYDSSGKLTGIAMFDRCFCVNIDGRNDRWEEFAGGIPEPWPYPPVERWQAIDGTKCLPPKWWSNGKGAWGCYRSHLVLLEQCLNNDIDSVLLLEDDAIFGSDFIKRMSNFSDDLPDDWGMVYLGGQLLNAIQHPPKKINRNVLKPFNVNRTHAFAVRGKMREVVYRHLCSDSWNPEHHVDHHLGTLIEQQKHAIYCPNNWLVGQRAGMSDICNKETPEIYWPEPSSYTRIEETPFVAVVGLHSSGSSCLAGVLYHLGVHMGNKLGGYYGSDPDTACGFEAIWLAKICEEAIPFLATGMVVTKEHAWAGLKSWINEKKFEASRKGSIAGGKYPQLCRLGNQLVNICGDGLRVIVSERCVRESIDSLVRRTGGKREKIEAHQLWLEEGKKELIAKLPPSRVLKIDYDWLLGRPDKAVTKVIQFLGLTPSKEQIDRAVKWVHPELKHVEAEDAA